MINRCNHRDLPEEDPRVVEPDYSVAFVHLSVSLSYQSIVTICSIIRITRLAVR